MCCDMVFSKQIQTYETVFNRDLNVSEMFPEEELFWELNE